MERNAVLQTDGLTRAFGGFVAVDGVSLQVERGSIHALIGPNGAGKTTLFNLLSRALPASAGTIRFAGEDITRRSPAEVARRGLVRSFQISSIFPDRTALQNVRLALARRARGQNLDFWRSGRVLAALDAEARHLLDEVGLGAQAARPAGALAYGAKRALEIATTLAAGPTLMLLDEPTAGMAHEDVARVVALIRRIRAGRTILMVEHNLGVVRDLCDRVTVLVRGRVLEEGGYADIAGSEAVRGAYLGADAE